MTGLFRERPTRTRGITSVNDWQLKRYEITLDGEPIDNEILEAVHAVLVRRVPMANSDGQVGFVIVHEGSDQVWLLIDLWHDEIIKQLTFCADLASPTQFGPVAQGGPTACVWELAVHAHEKDAYIRHVLDPAQGPRPHDYLADVLPNRNNRALVDAFNQAWTNGDVDSLMELMAPDPTYRASTGQGPGTDYRGRDAVRAGFAAVIEAEGPPNPEEPASSEVTVLGDKAISTWSYTTSTAEGETSVVEGIDVWTFESGRIKV
ncbi:MAG: nuclear transport factor 2 family protein, partial [Acidimicrobiales bacterium]